MGVHRWSSYSKTKNKNKDRKTKQGENNLGTRTETKLCSTEQQPLPNLNLTKRALKGPGKGPGCCSHHTC